MTTITTTETIAVAVAGNGLYTASEHYSALLRRLELSGRESFGLPFALGVTSFESGGGVTTVASNLAIAAARFGSHRVLLVDANLQRPAIHEVFKIERRLGLANLLVGGRLQNELAEGQLPYFVPSPVTNLSVLLPGALPDGSVPAYDSRSINDLLESLKHSFDLIIFDLPPANELTTCYAFASCMDGIVVVVEPRQVDRDVARRSARQLKEVNAKLLGVVYNKDRTQR